MGRNVARFLDFPRPPAQPKKYAFAEQGFIFVKPIPDKIYRARIKFPYLPIIFKVQINTV